MAFRCTMQKCKHYGLTSEGGKERKMKTLVIYPGSTVNHDSVFYILDPETGECLASHLCSHSGFAKSDLHNGRPERLQKWELKYGQKTEAKFIDETDYDFDKIYELNQKLAKESTTK